MNTAIVGINWGDEGKGRMVDYLAASYDLVARYQGGNNAGHTVINDKGSFVLNLLPSGVLTDKAVNIMGPGMLIDLEHLAGELGRLAAAGVEIPPGRLRISHRAAICLPCHPAQDILEEERLAAARFGSTRRGIAPGYADKYYKKALRMEDLFDIGQLFPRLEALAEWKNLTLVQAYGAQPVTADSLAAWLRQYGQPLLPYICDTGDCLREAQAAGQSILFEAQLGALRDVDYGIYPFTTSSTTLAAYAPIGAGLPGLKLDKVIGVIKAYSSCVGEGPFTAEMFGPEAESLREAGSEYGAATGRPRRVGGFDLVASRYGAQVQGADELALTKLDVLSYMERIPVVTAYMVNGAERRDFPSGPELTAAQPKIEYLPGFDQDISNCRRYASLPQAARRYVEMIEDQVGVAVKYVSVGAKRDQLIVR